MKRSLIVLAGIAALSAGACTIVAPDTPDAMIIYKPVIVPIRPDALPPPKPLQASVLYVANLQKSSANLSGQYAGIITGLAAYYVARLFLERTPLLPEDRRIGKHHATGAGRRPRG